MEIELANKIRGGGEASMLQAIQEFRDVPRGQRRRIMAGIIANLCREQLVYLEDFVTFLRRYFGRFHCVDELLMGVEEVLKFLNSLALDAPAKHRYVVLVYGLVEESSDVVGLKELLDTSIDTVGETLCMIGEGTVQVATAICDGISKLDKMLK